MKTNPNNLAIYSIRNRKSKINPRPRYQRSPVWSESQKQLLIDSILRGYDIPKFYFRVLENDSEFEHEVVDGQQRLRAIWEFLDNKFPLGEESRDFDDLPDLFGKFYEDLTSDQQDIIGSFNLSITEIRNATESEIRELFLRLQEGKTLNPAEKRNAMTGNMRDFIAELAETHSVFTYIKKENTRFLYDDWAAHIAALEINGGPADLKAKNLKTLYEQNTEFNKNGPVANKIRKTLNFLAKILKKQPPEMNIKWGFVDLYLLISSLIDKYDIKDREEDFLSFFIGFEKQRRGVDDPAELITENNSSWDKDLYGYIVSFQKDGSLKESIENRHKVYLRTFLYSFPDLTPKDPKRFFTEDERIVIWRNAGEKCEQCDTPIDLNEMHADHIVPHSKGGMTSISNAQALCGPCNTKKSAKV